MRNFIRWVALPFRVAFFLVTCFGLLLPGVLLLGFFSWEAGVDIWCWFCNHCGMGDLDKWNHIVHAPDCPNATLVAERYTDVESRPKTPSNSVNPNEDSGIKRQEDRNSENAVGNQR